MACIEARGLRKAFENNGCGGRYYLRVEEGPHPRTYRAQRGGQDHSAQCDFRPHLISG